MNGYAMGLGATVALLADVVVVSPSSVIADTHVNMGIGAGDGGQVIWPYLIGVNRAKYYLMTKALEVANKLAAGAPQAIAAFQERRTEKIYGK